jgi:hypothetical protein
MLSLSGTGRRPSKPLPCEAGNTSLRPEARTASGATVLYRPGHQAPPADRRATDRSPSPRHTALPFTQTPARPTPRTR